MSYGTWKGWCLYKYSYTNVDPKQFKHPTPHMKGAKGSQHHFRAEEGGHTNQHQGGQV